MFINTNIQQNLKSPLAIMTPNSVVSNHVGEDGARAVLNTDWVPLVFTPDPVFEVNFMASARSLNSKLLTMIDAFQYAAQTSLYDVHAAVFTAGYTPDIRIRLIPQELAILRSDAVHAVIIPNSQSDWFYNTFRQEQNALIDELENSDLVNFLKNNRGLFNGDLAFRRMASKYKLKLVQLDAEPAGLLKAYASLEPKKPWIIWIFVCILVLFFLGLNKLYFFRPWSSS